MRCTPLSNLGLLQTPRWCGAMPWVHWDDTCMFLHLSPPNTSRPGDLVGATDQHGSSMGPEAQEKCTTKQVTPRGSAGDLEYRIPPNLSSKCSANWRRVKAKLQDAAAETSPFALTLYGFRKSALLSSSSLTCLVVSTDTRPAKETSEHSQCRDPQPARRQPKAGERSASRQTPSAPAVPRHRPRY